jgi:hypothetical protein
VKTDLSAYRDRQDEAVDKYKILEEEDQPTNTVYKNRDGRESAQRKVDKQENKWERGMKGTSTTQRKRVGLESQVTMGHRKLYNDGHQNVSSPYTFTNFIEHSSS